MLPDCCNPSSFDSDARNKCNEAVLAGAYGALDFDYTIGTATATDPMTVTEENPTMDESNTNTNTHTYDTVNMTLTETLFATTESMKEDTVIEPYPRQPKPCGRVHPTLQQVDATVEDVESLRQLLLADDPTVIPPES